MKPLAFIFTVDCNQQADEKRFDYMSLLLLDSIKRFNPYADIYCGVFSSRTPNCKPELLERTSDPHFHYIEDVKFYIGKKPNAGYLRSYCCHYFTHVVDLTEQYENVVYLDIDVILTAPFVPELHKPNDGVVIYEQFCEMIRFYESACTTRFSKFSGHLDWFHNWLQVLNKSNKHVYSDRSDELGVHKKQFFGDLYFSKMLRKYSEEGRIKLEHQTIGTIPFYSLYNKHHFCIHYDDFERRGTFVCTKSMLSSVDYVTFKIKGENYLQQSCDNDPNLLYWRVAISNYKKYKPNNLPDFPNYDGDII